MTFDKFNQLLFEHPDELYADTEGEPRSFAFQKNYYMYFTKFRYGTHGDLFRLASDDISGAARSSDREYETYQSFESDFHSKGVPHSSFINYLNNEEYREERFYRSFMLENLPSMIIGRIDLRKKLVSVWNSYSRIYSEDIRKLLKIPELYNENPKEYKFQFYESEFYSYDDVVNQRVEKPKSFSSDLSAKIVHNVNPVLKHQVLKNLGVRPKVPLGAQQRFQMGESLIKENPDHIRPRLNPSSNNGNAIRYDNTSNLEECYSVFFYKNPNNEYKYFYRKDDNSEAGHDNLTTKLKMTALNYFDKSDIISEEPIEEVYQNFSRMSAVELRVWKINKICSFWNSYDKNLVDVTFRVLKRLHQNPKDYIFETNSRTYSPNFDDEYVYSYKEFSSGKKEETEEKKPEDYSLLFKGNKSKKEDDESIKTFQALKKGLSLNDLKPVTNKPKSKFKSFFYNRNQD